MDLTGAVKFSVRKTTVYLNGQPTVEFKWRVWPPFDTGKGGGTVVVKVLGSGDHEIKLYSDIFEPKEVIVPKGRNATANISAGAVVGEYYEFQVYIDGEFAEANSSPGVIIE